MIQLRLITRPTLHTRIFDLNLRQLPKDLSKLVAMGVFEGKFPQWVYLIGYNTISALLWSLIFTRTALTVVADGPEGVYPAVRILLLFTQTMAALEVLHANLGKATLFSCQPPRLLPFKHVTHSC